MELNFDVKKEEAFEKAGLTENSYSDRWDYFWDKIFFQTFPIQYNNNKEGALKETLKKRIKEELARGYKYNPFDGKLSEEYDDTVKFLKRMDNRYPDSFKALVLNEMLSKSFKWDDKNKAFIKKVDNTKKLSSFNLFNDTIEYIFLNAMSDDKDYRRIERENKEKVAKGASSSELEPLKPRRSFKKLHEDAMKDHTVRNNALKRVQPVEFLGMNTYGKGYWCKIRGKENDSKHFEENWQALAVISNLTGAGWCTTGRAHDYLLDGDFYIFFDDQKMPRIAIWTYEKPQTGKKAIVQIVGVKYGLYQVIEPELLDVTINILSKGKQYENSQDLLLFFKWNKRLIDHAKRIEAGKVYDEKQFETLLYDMNYYFLNSEVIDRSGAINTEPKVNFYYKDLDDAIRSNREFKAQFEKFLESKGIEEYAGQGRFWVKDKYGCNTDYWRKMAKKEADFASPTAKSEGEIMQQ